MQPGREIDARVAKEIFDHQVFEQDGVLHENMGSNVQPLRHYSSEMQWAWLVAEKMRVSIIPIEGGYWFAFFSQLEGWGSPESFLDFLNTGDFSKCGAAVSENAALAICEAALIANHKQKGLISVTTVPEIKPNNSESSSTLH